MCSISIHCLLLISRQTEYFSHVPLDVGSKDHTFLGLYLDIKQDLPSFLLNPDGILVTTQLPTHLLSLGHTEQIEMTVRDNLDPSHVHSYHLVTILVS